MRAIKNFFTRLFTKLHLIHPKQYIVRQYGTLIGSYTANSEAHALETMAASFGHKSFDEFCRVLGISPEAHKLEVVK